MKRNAIIFYKTAAEGGKHIEGHSLITKPIFLPWRKAIDMALEDIEKGIKTDFVVTNIIFF